MLYKLLLCTLLVSASTAYTMEPVNFLKIISTLEINYRSNLSGLNKTIYELFLDNNITEAKKILPRKEEEITSLLVYSCHTNNSNFLEWILHTKKPLFDSSCVQNVLEYAKFYSHNASTPIFNKYVEQEKKKLQQELDKYVRTEEQRIIQYKKASLKNTQTNDDHACLCIIS